MNCLDSVEVPELEALEYPFCVGIWLISYDKMRVRAELDAVVVFKQLMDVIHVFFADVVLHGG